MDALEFLVAPTSTEAFFERYWERRPLVVARRAPDHYRGLFGLTDLDRLVAATSTLQLTQRGYDIPVRTIPRGRRQLVDVVDVNRRIGDGATVVIDDIDALVPAVGELDARLARALSAKVWTNLYFTPGGKNRGLAPHFDPHDVFVLQIHGQKEWKLYGRPVGVPLPSHRFDEDTMRVGKISRRLTLGRGDLLYIPKGLGHSAESGSEASVHLTIGIESVTWADLLLEACRDHVARTESLRRGLPIGFARSTANHRTIAKTLSAIAGTLKRDLDTPRALAALTERLAREALRPVPGLLEQTLRNDELGPDAIVGVRPGLAWSLRAARSAITLRCHGDALTFARARAAALRHALAHERFTIRELPGGGTKSNVALVRTLLSEGVLRVLDAQGAGTS